MSNNRYSNEFKTDILLAYKNRECTVKEFCLQFNITEPSLRTWVKL
ncbi:transposase [Jeotgalibacillus campisalis]|nr:transposase [Jeotgalibacillus campisalis]